MDKDNILGKQKRNAGLLANYFLCILVFSVCSLGIAYALPTQQKSRVVEGGGTGPYKAIMLSDRSLFSHTIFIPQDLSVFGKKNRLPIITWGNGACANSPWEHVNFLNEVASHGFLVIAIGPMPEEGEKTKGKSESSQLIDAINWAIASNSDKHCPYYKKIDVSNIAASGMSCGGLQTLEVAPDERITTTVICNSGILANPGVGLVWMIIGVLTMYLFLLAIWMSGMLEPTANHMVVNLPG